MNALADTSILIDVLRGEPAAAQTLYRALGAGPLHASEVVRLEVLAGMRAHEDARTRALLGIFIWHPVDEQIAEIAGELGRRWLPGNRGIDAADLAIAATAILLDAQLLTKNVQHFPMFDGLSTPY